jgi:hypothetical protein
MSRRLPFSKANIRRRVEVARENGLFVVAIKVDGTLAVSDRPDPIRQVLDEATAVLATELAS